ncbi:hypothetical protein MCOR25_011026 [Pyricularia grisea]|uniref:Stress-response A/B barrel domain-containing protein n=1 Tax=Pyricularia grisea TaxID=148305 RepID=A0A6P8APT0_PYRGI|nr:hypothetical protein PgNI_11346 [Pyricularia grisea]KAI6345508.1 hypothetical protein MCOR25_011026 [Pyricularia grisea]TLD04036.1 hypothetical protein PgNI_11346 [Pyricularia grisea]
MAVVHVVLFSFKESATQEEIEDVYKGMVALKDKCIHPTTNQPYIKSAKGGINNSPAGLDGGIQYAFVSEFESVEDRDYFNQKDSVHLELVAKLSILSKVQVIDFTPGVFA